MKCAAIKASSAKKVEKNVNKWLEEHPNIKIRFITQAHGWIGSSAVINTIYYEED